MTGQNISNQTFDNLTENIIACNVENCTFNNVENITFERCNVRHSTFNSTSHFDRCNLIVCDLVEGSTYEKTNIINEDDEDELEMPIK